MFFDESVNNSHLAKFVVTDPTKLFDTKKQHKTTTTTPKQLPPPPPAPTKKGEKRREKKGDKIVKRKGREI